MGGLLSSVYCRMFSSTLGLYVLDASDSTPSSPVVTTKNVTRTLEQKPPNLSLPKVPKLARGATLDVNTWPFSTPRSMHFFFAYVLLRVFVQT